jgi:hypothetical protein
MFLFRSCPLLSPALCARRSEASAATCSPSRKCTTTGAQCTRCGGGMRLSRDRCARRYIRESAVVLVVRILKRYGAAYPTLIPRTMRTLLHALLDPSKVCWRTLFLYPVLFIYIIRWCLVYLLRASCLLFPCSAAVLHSLRRAERYIHNVSPLHRHVAAAPHATVRRHPLSSTKPPTPSNEKCETKMIAFLDFVFCAGKCDTCCRQVPQASLSRHPHRPFRALHLRRPRLCQWCHQAQAAHQAVACAAGACALPAGALVSCVAGGILRVLRNFQGRGAVPAEVRPQPALTSNHWHVLIFLQHTSSCR